MEKEFLWKLFSKTGDVNAYLLLKEYEKLMSKDKEDLEDLDKNIQNITLR